MDDEPLSLDEWFSNAGGFRPRHDPETLRRGIDAGFLDEQDEVGLTALGLAVLSKWRAGVEALLAAGADTELRYFRTGETALYMAIVDRNEEFVTLLLSAGANPDALNVRGMTPRTIAEKFLPNFRGFDSVPPRDAQRPVPYVQNAEHLADHYWPQFKIPERAERENLTPGQAVDLYVYGPLADGKQDTVKVRITHRGGRPPAVRYAGTVETPADRTHLPAGTTEVTFGPEHVASVYLPRPGS